MTVPVLQVGLEGVDFTLVDVHEGFDQAFNEWYENDHFYAGGVLGPGVLAGRRWVATRALREARFIGRVVGSEALFPDPMAGTNLATYFFNPQGSQAFKDWVIPQLAALRSLGRMFIERDAIHICLYRFVDVLEHPERSRVPAHVALDHPFPGLVATLGTSLSGERAVAPPLPPGSLTLRFHRQPNALFVPMPDVSRFDPLTLLLTFLPQAPIASLDAITSIARSAATLAGIEPLWSSGFLPVVPGAPTHLDAMR